mgnify:FL=1
MKTLTKEQYISNSIEIFNKCIAEHGDWLKDYMYMHTDNDNIHWFKNIISRKYVGVKI